MPALLFVSLLNAAVLPDKFGPYTRGAVTAPALADPSLWKEYGLKTSEQATYTGPQTFTVTAYQFSDPTGAAAAFDWQRPPNAMASTVANLAVLNPGGELVVFGNYLLRIEGWQPAAPDLANLARSLPAVSRASLPIIRSYMPERGLVAMSDRYILGPVSLQRFAPQIPAAAVAFEQFSTEGEIGTYRTPGGDVTLSLFMFPTPQIARERLEAFKRVPGASVKRTGMIIAVVTPAAPGGVLNAAQSDAAHRMFDRIEYRPEFMLTQTVRKPENVGQMIIAIFTLAGILIAAALVFGLLFGGFWAFGKKFGIRSAEESFTTLHLSGK